MIEFIATHDVDDVEHWFTSQKRAEFFGPRGIKTTAMRVPENGGKTVAVLIATPDMETFENALAEPAAQEAIAHDGVHIDTMRVFMPT